MAGRADQAGGLAGHLVACAPRMERAILPGPEDVLEAIVEIGAC